MDISNINSENPFLIYRTPLFDRCLEDMSKKKGTDLISAKKVYEILRYFTQEGQTSREKYGLTWKGENRIKNCIKIDLVGGSRLVCIKKDCYLILLYVGSHDDCLRWIERNKGLTYELDQTAKLFTVLPGKVKQSDTLPEDVMEERRFLADYEAKLMKRIDNKVLIDVFSGLSKSKHAEE